MEQYTSEQALFQAWDCSQPTSVRDVSFPALKACHIPGEVTRQKEATYQVLSMHNDIRVNGTRCVMTKTRTAFYCGVYDHQTHLPSQSYVEAPRAVSIEECRGYVQTLEYKHRDHKPVALLHNSVNLIRFEERGVVYTSNGEVKCRGDDTVIDGVLIEDLVVSVQLKLTLSDELLVFKEATTIAHTSDVRVPCEPNTGGCQTATATFLWTKPPSDCDLLLTKEITGTEATDNEATVFMSTDGTAVRLILEGEHSRCGRIVTSTNYPDIFLYSTTRRHQFQPQSTEGQLSLTTFVKNRDDYVYHHAMQQVAEEFRAVIGQECHVREQQSRLAFWVQQQNPGATTWVLGNGTFATAAGEVLYQYHCQEVLVVGQDRDTCFQELPVRRVSLGPQGNERPLFMEPLTHRLTHQGIPKPCSDTFVAKYKSMQHGWIMASPRLLATSTPKEVRDTSRVTLEYDVSPDFTTGGLYTNAQLTEIETYLEFSRTKEALGAQLATQNTQQWAGQGISPGQLFPDAFPNISWTQGIVSRAMEFFHFWGELAAITLGMYLMGRFLLYLLQLAYSVFLMRNTHGCNWGILWMLCPATFLLRHYHQAMRDSEVTAAAENITVGSGEREGSDSYMDHDGITNSNGDSASPPTVPHYEWVTPVRGPEVLSAPPMGTPPALTTFSSTPKRRCH